MAGRNRGSSFTLLLNLNSFLNIMPDVISLDFSYLFHYICHDRIIYLCITDDVSMRFVEFPWSLRLFSPTEQ